MQIVKIVMVALPTMMNFRDGDMRLMMLITKARSSRRKVTIIRMEVLPTRSLPW